VDYRSVDLVEVPAAVNAQLAEYFSYRAPEVAALGSPFQKSVSYLEQFVLGGGKRIRPLYGWAGFVGGGGLEKGEEDPQSVLRAVSALEFIQACALIHDDIIDASDTRRGQPTVHRAIEAEHQERDFLGSSPAFGEHAAILIGDLALVWAEDMWRSSGVSNAALDRAAEPWQGMRTEVIGGQLLDIMLEAEGSESAEAANTVNRYKTAAYTIERPLHLGAALAGATDAIIEAFRGYGRDIGMAFQLRDDMLGVFGDSAITGKPAGDDLREGKRTVLYATALKLLDEADPGQAAKLRAGIGTVEDPDAVDEIASIIGGSGAVEAVEEEIDRLSTSGLAHLDSVTLSDEVGEILRTLAIKSTARRS